MTAVVEAMEKRILDKSGSLRSEKVVLKMVDAVEGTVRVGGCYKITSGRRDLYTQTAELTFSFTLITRCDTAFLLSWSSRPVR